MPKKASKPNPTVGGVTLKALAAHVKLTPGTVSSVLNEAPSARAIPQHTKDRILAAARELNYRPSFFARNLRNKRTYTIGVIAEEIGDAYGSMVISGIEAYLRKKKYFFLTVIHRHDPQLLMEYSDMLLDRGVEGFITIDTALTKTPVIPTVSVAGHRKLSGVTNIVLDHRRAALEALTHLKELGHKKIAFMKGQAFSSDSEDRWKSICEVSRELGIEMHPELILQLSLNDPSPQLGYPVGTELLSRTRDFTALFAYNDISAIGAIRAFHESDLRVPEDISVIGFDDIREAAFHSPSLTTIRQPLPEMGEIAAETLVNHLETGQPIPGEIAVQPRLMIRETTAPVRVALSDRKIKLSDQARNTTQLVPTLKA